MAVIRCRNCNYQEEANKEFFFKVLGGGLVGGGYWAWVTYFFAGTGFAFALCVAMVVGGVALLAFSDQVTKFVSDRYACPDCSERKWELVK